MSKNTKNFIRRILQNNGVFFLKNTLFKKEFYGKNKPLKNYTRSGGIKNKNFLGLSKAQ